MLFNFLSQLLDKAIMKLLFQVNKINSKLFCLILNITLCVIVRLVWLFVLGVVLFHQSFFFFFFFFWKWSKQQKGEGTKREIHQEKIPFGFAGNSK